MQREVWTLNEAWVTVWLESGGAKSGPALLEAEYVRNLSLVERFDLVKKGQPGVDYQSRIVNDIQNVFQMSSDYLSKAVTDSITVPTSMYWIEIALVNPAYASAGLSDDTHTLKHCVVSEKSKTGQDNDVIKEALNYDVGETA